VLLIAILAGLTIVTRIQDPRSPGGHADATPKSVARPRRRIVARRTRNGLPQPLSGEAVLAGANGVIVVGGLNRADESTGGVYELNASTGRVVTAGSLSEPRHDTAAASLSGEVLVFGGGSATELDSVEALRGGASGRLVGHLPTTRSDLSAAALAGRAYVLGGYDGEAPAGAILQTTDGSHFTTVTTLPVPFRYAAVAALGSTIYAFGGELANGADSNAIQAFDTVTRRATVIAHLPQALSHASAVSLGGLMYILGGRTSEVPTDRILSFDPARRRVHLAGHLPFPLTNAAAATVGSVGYLVGGIDAQGSSSASVIELRLVSGGG
jgi:N-acetylneuraminic acid mutarotase